MVQRISVPLRRVTAHGTPPLYMPSNTVHATAPVPHSVTCTPARLLPKALLPLCAAKPWPRSTSDAPPSSDPLRRLTELTLLGC